MSPTQHLAPGPAPKGQRNSVLTGWAARLSGSAPAQEMPRGQGRRCPHLGPSPGYTLTTWATSGAPPSTASSLGSSRDISRRPRPLQGEQGLGLVPPGEACGAPRGTQPTPSLPCSGAGHPHVAQGYWRAGRSAPLAEAAHPSGPHRAAPGVFPDHSPVVGGARALSPAVAFSPIAPSAHRDPRRTHPGLWPSARLRLTTPSAQGQVPTGPLHRLLPGGPSLLSPQET